MLDLDKINEVISNLQSLVDNLTDLDETQSNIETINEYLSIVKDDVTKWLVETRQTLNKAHKNIEDSRVNSEKSYLTIKQETENLHVNQKQEFLNLNTTLKEDITNHKDTMLKTAEKNYQAIENMTKELHKSLLKEIANNHQSIKNENSEWFQAIKGEMSDTLGEIQDLSSRVEKDNNEQKELIKTNLHSLNKELVLFRDTLNQLEQSRMEIMSNKFTCLEQKLEDLKTSNSDRFDDIVKKAKLGFWSMIIGFSVIIGIVLCIYMKIK